LTPARTGGKRGNFEIQRTFKNVGEIRISSGTDNIRVYRQRVALLEKLAKMERWELLRALRDRKVTIEELVEADREERLGASLDGIALAAPLWSTIEATLPRMGGKRNPAATQHRYAKSFRALQRKGRKWLPDDARVEDLRKVDWTELAEAWGGSGTDWMHLRRAVSAFISRYLDLYHPFRREVMKAIDTKPENKRKPNVSVERFQRIVRHAPEHIQAAYWTLVITGMRLNEYLSRTRDDLDRETHTIVIEHGKNEQSDQVIEVDPRWWGYISSAIPCPVKEKWLRKKWNEAVKAAGFKNVHLHDLRHCHGQWADDAGATPAQTQDSMRHKSAAMTRQYQLRGSTRAVSAALADHIIVAPKKARRA
jgi:integrase